MSNEQNQAKEILDQWGKQMQEAIRDPRVADMMMEYYLKSKNIFERFSQDGGSNDKPATTNDDAASTIAKLSERIEQLEAKVAILERLISANLK